MASVLAGGFADVPIDAAHTFRAALQAMARPGRIEQVEVPTRLLTGIQAVEYVRAFLIGRVGWNGLGGNLIISGAFGLFSRDALMEIGGYEHESIGEDMELVVRLRRQGYESKRGARVVFSPDPVAWTEAPEDIRSLARQRNRWQRGLLDVLVRHRRMVLNPRYRSAGMLAMPYFVLVEALAPILEATGLILLAAGLLLGWYSTGVLISVAVVMAAGIVTTILTLLLDDVTFRTYQGGSARLRLIGYAILEQLVYRPCTLVWRVWGTWLFLRGRGEWGVQRRQGMTVETAAA